jgi:hypothetical protein
MGETYWERFQGQGREEAIDRDNPRVITMVEVAEALIAADPNMTQEDVVNSIVILSDTSSRSYREYVIGVVAYVFEDHA